MPGKQRHYEVYVGEQFSGKTRRLRRRIRVLEKKRKIEAVFICDTKNEFYDMGAVVHSFADYAAVSLDSIPRVVVWELGENPLAYEVVFEEAIEQGGCVIVLDEGYIFAKAGSNWKSATLQRIVLSGRHLTNNEGKECVTHLLVACQYPKTLQHMLWSQARTIMCGKIQGENPRAWVRDNFGVDALARVDELEPWHWVLLRGPRPVFGEDRW